MDDTGDINLVELWLKWDPKRWIAGALAGAFAGIVLLGAGMLLALAFGNEVWFPVKVAALPVLGGAATEFGMNLGSILTGLIVTEAVAVFLGIVFAQFVPTNSFTALAGMGVVWGVFGWIFIHNLFIQSFRPVFAAQLSPAAAFPVWLAFGLALTSVAFFDRTLRGGSRI